MTRLPFHAAVLCAALALPIPAYALDEGSQQELSLSLARQMQQNGNLAGAESIYRKLAEKSDTKVEANIALAKLYRKASRPQDALTVLNAAEAETPDNPDMLLLKGYTLIDLQQSQEAVAALDKLTDIEPDNASAYSAKGVAFDSAGNHMAAQELYQKALSFEPGSLPIRNNLAMSYILDNQPREAIPILEALYKQDSSQAAVRQNLALAYGLTGNADRATQLNLKALSKEQAEENLKFYKKYATLSKHKAPEAAPIMPADEEKVEAPASKPAPLVADKEPEEDAHAIEEAAPASGSATLAPGPEQDMNESFMGYKAIRNYPTR